jgi:hypothetical protein
VRFKIVVPLAEQKSLAAPHNTTNATETTVQKLVLSMDCRKTKAASMESTLKRRRQTDTNDVVEDV